MSSNEHDDIDLDDDAYIAQLIAEAAAEKAVKSETSGVGVFLLDHLVFEGCFMLSHSTSQWFNFDINPG